MMSKTLLEQAAGESPGRGRRIIKFTTLRVIASAGDEDHAVRQHDWRDGQSCPVHARRDAPNPRGRIIDFR